MQNLKKDGKNPLTQKTRYIVVNENTRQRKEDCAKYHINIFGSKEEYEEFKNDMEELSINIEDETYPVVFMGNVVLEE